MSDTKEDFSRHLARLGFELEAPRDWIEKKFRRYLGDERFAEFQAMGKAPPGRERQHRVYEWIRDPIEANLFRSLDAGVTVEASYNLYQKCKPLLLPGKRVIELGCWTGSLASFIAENHPQVQVVGVDRVARVIEINKTQYRSPNLDFELWDYQMPKPDSLLPADVLLCSLGIHNIPDGYYDEPELNSLRPSKGYHRHKADAAVYFANWRQAANPGAALLAILRIVTFGRFLGFMDAAQEAGWTADLEQAEAVPVPSNNDFLPSFVFTARDSKQISEDQALAHFVRVTTLGDPYVRLVGGLALAVYRSIANKSVLLKIRHPNEAGILTYEEVGIGGAYGYVFVRDAQPQYQLLMISTKRARKHAESVRAQKPPPQATVPNSKVFVVKAQDAFGGSGFGSLAGPVQDKNSDSTHKQP